MPEKVGALTPLGFKIGQCNGTPKKMGANKGHFPSHFYYTTNAQFGLGMWQKIGLGCIGLEIDSNFVI